MTVQIDPKLEVALRGAGPFNIFATVRRAPSSEDAAAIARRLILRVAKLTHESTPRFNYRDLDCVLHVNANRRFIKELIKQPEVLEASIVPDVGSAMIEPINPRNASDSEISHPTYPRRHISNR